MRIHIDPPSSSTRTIHASALVPREQLAGDGRDQLLRHGLPAGLDLVIGPVSARRSRAGWPVDLLAVDVVTSDGAIIERRFVAVYRFLEHAGTAFVAGPPAELAAERDAIVAALLSGRPDWRSQPASLHELFDF